MSELPRGYPVHYVLALDRRDMVASRYGIKDIVASFACDLSEIDDLYQRYVIPLTARGVNLTWYIFAREGPNPFLEAEASEKQTIYDMIARGEKAYTEEPATAPDYIGDDAWK